MARDWGYWTEHKLEMLSEYLHAFTTASKTAGATIYLDLFAGEANNISRTTGEPIEGSPRIALRTVPTFTRFALFELPGRAARLEDDLRREFPGRDQTWKVWSGDCNVAIDVALAELAPLNYAATFALIDQYAAEVTWATLERIAAFKRNRRYKAELWLLFAHAMLPRGLAASDYQSFEAFVRRVDALYGSREWEPAHAARQRGELDASGLRDELLNLMRWRLENRLGYTHTHAFEMKNSQGTPIYSMIFATDNAAGDKIMSDIYAKAARKRPQMQAEAAAKAQARRDDERGTPGLFDPIPKTRPEELYIHEPPTLPYGMADPG